MRRNKVLLKLLGVIMAIIGAVIIVHTVPVFVWYCLLVVLVLSIAAIIFFT
ncbi:hypothetical protein KCX82_01445 [Clostridiales bacterium BAD-6]|uniref:Uncharacterized protein n=1 Tax=Sinanaerobacter chloroacetimidivorans TaxID=2818044 RepID=A0A8J8AZH3_9FIRM|nr:hypothetical protein [Sinanaerobacter chloroacetimidivorans]